MLSANTIIGVGEPLPKKVLDGAVDSTVVAAQTFATERRGYNQRQVQQYLNAVANALADAQQREADMRTRLGKAVRRAEAAEKALRDAPTHDPAKLNREFGEQVAGVLEAARIAGDKRLDAATKAADELREQAASAAAKMRADVESELHERSQQREAESADIIASARADADALLRQAADMVHRARNEGDALIREAEEARAQILEDMERRRRQARAQVERLRVGRDRLLRSYEVVRRTLEETTVELKSSLGEAKVRGDGAARAMSAEPLASRDQLEAELRDAKLIGRITFSDAVAAPEQDPAQRTSSSPTSPSSPSMQRKPREIRSKALPRPLDPPPEPPASSTDTPPTPSPVFTPSSPPTPKRPKVTASGARRAKTGPKAPAMAPSLGASSHDRVPPDDPIAIMMRAVEAKEAGAAAPAPAAPRRAQREGTSAAEPIDDELDAELASLEDGNLNVIEPNDDIEDVTAVALDPSVEAPDLFNALREQRVSAEAKEASETTGTAKRGTAKPRKSKAKTGKAKTGKAKAASRKSSPTKSSRSKAKRPADITEPAGLHDALQEQFPGLEAQRKAVVADAAAQIETQLKRALASEQDDLLAGIRTHASASTPLLDLVGDVDDHVSRYVVAMSEVAAVTFGAGVALADEDASEALVEHRLPAGAVEETVMEMLVLPQRDQLRDLDDLNVEAADALIDAIRVMYQRRTSHDLGAAAHQLASMLCVAGLCEALPAHVALPWVDRPAPAALSGAAK